MYLPRRIPQELVDMVISNVHDKADLKRCALACRSWTHASQQRLFRVVSIPLGTSSARGLHQVLRQSPHLAKYVQDVTIVIYGNDDFEGYSTHAHQLLAIILMQFYRLKKISLDGAFDGDIDISLLDTLRNIISSPRTTHVSLVGEWYFRDLAHFRSLMGANLTSLESLEIKGVSICSPGAAVSMPERRDSPPVVINSLVVEGPFSDFTEWFSSLMDPIVVKRFHLEGFGEATPLLSSLGSGLEELDLIIHDGKHLSLAIQHDGPSNFEYLHILSKLSVTFYHGVVQSLKTLPMDNHLEFLEIKALDCEFFEITPSFKCLDELLFLEHFSRLKTVVLSTMQHSLGTDELKAIKKAMRFAIRRNILQLRLYLTGKLLDSAQIRERAAFYEVCYPTDFPCYMEATTVKEGVAEEETVAELSDWPHFLGSFKGFNTSSPSPFQRYTPFPPLPSVWDLFGPVYNAQRDRYPPFPPLPSVWDLFGPVYNAQLDVSFPAQPLQYYLESAPNISPTAISGFQDTADPMTTSSTSWNTNIFGVDSSVYTQLPDTSAPLLDNSSSDAETYPSSPAVNEPPMDGATERSFFLPSTPPSPINPSIYPGIHLETEAHEGSHQSAPFTESLILPPLRWHPPQPSPSHVRLPSSSSDSLFTESLVLPPLPLHRKSTSSSNIPLLPHPPNLF